MRKKNTGERYLLKNTKLYRKLYNLQILHSPPTLIMLCCFIGNIQYQCNLHKQQKVRKKIIDICSSGRKDNSLLVLFKLEEIIVSLIPPATTIYQQFHAILISTYFLPQLLYSHSHLLLICPSPLPWFQWLITDSEMSDIMKKQRTTNEKLGLSHLKRLCSLGLYR